MENKTYNVDRVYILLYCIYEIEMNDDDINDCYNDNNTE